MISHLVNSRLSLQEIKWTALLLHAHRVGTQNLKLPDIKQPPHTWGCSCDLSSSEDCRLGTMIISVLARTVHLGQRPSTPRYCTYIGSNGLDSNPLQGSTLMYTETRAAHTDPRSPTSVTQTNPIRNLTTPIHFLSLLPCPRPGPPSLSIVLESSAEYSSPPSPAT